MTAALLDRLTHKADTINCHWESYRLKQSQPKSKARIGRKHKHGNYSIQSPKGRLKTIDVEFTKDNTTWFNNCRSPRDIYMITDFEGGLLIRESDYTYPVWIYEISRADIGHSQKKARQLLQMHM